MTKLVAQDIELALSHHFNSRVNLIVPNVSWGLQLGYEADLVVVTPSKYAFEIEIKVSASDLKRDFLKRHGHKSSKFKRLYFAVPDSLQLTALDCIPERSGLFTVDKFGYVRLIRPPHLNLGARKLSEQEMKHLYELMAMRVWNLKEKLHFYYRNKGVK